MTTADLIRAHTSAVLLARAAYRADIAAATPKTDRQTGSGVGICDRCGIDSTDLRRQKCPPCKEYLVRRAKRLTEQDRKQP